MPKKDYPKLHPTDLSPLITKAMKDEAIMMICRRIHNVLKEIEGKTDYFVVTGNESVAKLTGIANEDLIDIRSEKIEPSILFLHFLCKQYRVNPTYILLGKGEKFITK